MSSPRHASATSWSRQEFAGLDWRYLNDRQVLRMRRCAADVAD